MPDPERQQIEVDALTDSDLRNLQGVYFMPENVVGPIVVFRRIRRMTRRAALVHAAWLVRASTDDDAEFQAILDRVRDQPLDERTQRDGDELTTMTSKGTAS